MADHIRNPDNGNLLQYLKDYFAGLECRNMLPSNPDTRQGKIDKAIEAGERLLFILNEVNTITDNLLFVDDIQFKGKCMGICYYVSMNRPVPDPRVMNFNIKNFIGSIDFRVPKYVRERADFSKQNNSGWKTLNLNQYDDNEIVKAIEDYLHAILGDAEFKSIFQEKSKPQRFIYDLITEIYTNYQIYYNYKPDFLQKVNITGYTGHRELDIYIKDINLALEVQGGHHYHFTPQFHRDQDHFIKLQERDKWKVKKCEEKDIRLIWIKEKSVIQELMKLPIEVARTNVANFIDLFLKNNQSFAHWDNV